MISNSLYIPTTEDVNYNFLVKKDSSILDACLDLFGASVDTKFSVDNYSIVYEIYEMYAKDISTMFKSYGLGALSSSNFMHYLHEDINRLDLYINIFGFRRGKNDLSAINELEQIALSQNRLSDMHFKNILFEFDRGNAEIDEFKRKFAHKLLSSENVTRDKERVLNSFVRVILKPYILDLNSKIVSQMVITDSGIVPEEKELKKEDCFEIYYKSKKLIMEYIDVAYFKAYWRALNQRVLKRYR